MVMQTQMFTLAAISLWISGCGLVGTADFKATKTITLAHAAGKPIDVQTENGSVEVRQGGTEVSVTASLRATTQARLDEMAVTLERTEDGTLRVVPVWPQGGRTGNEGCSIVLTLPDMSGATIGTTNGSISVDGPAGAVRARSANGKITLAGVRSVDAETSNGSITIALAADATGPVRADTSNGQVSLALGKAFVGQLTASTSNGSISDKSGLATRTQKIRSTRGIFDFGGVSLPASSLETSNGSITITAVP
jgi:DUF4097 and DUF4098 domain-containing protein YvlB